MVVPPDPALAERRGDAATRSAGGLGGPSRPPISLIHQPEDRLAHAPDVLHHESLGALDVAALERVDDGQVLADEPLDAAGRQDGHGPHGPDLLADLLERLEQLAVARRLDQVAMELLAERPHRRVGDVPAAAQLAEAPLELLEV